MGIEQSKDPLRRRHGRLEDVVLLGKILQRLKETPHQLQEGRHGADGQRFTFDQHARCHQQTGQCQCGEKLDGREIQRVIRDRFQLSIEMPLIERLETGDLTRFPTEELYNANARQALPR